MAKKHSHNPSDKNFVRVCTQTGAIFESLCVSPGSVIGRFFDGVEPVFFVYAKRGTEKIEKTLCVKTHKRSWAKNTWNSCLLGDEHPISKMILSVLPELKEQILGAWKAPSYSCRNMGPKERRVGRYDADINYQYQIDGRSWDESWTEIWVPRYDGMRCTYNEAQGSKIPVTEFEGITDTEEWKRRDHLKVDPTKNKPKKKKE